MITYYTYNEETKQLTPVKRVLKQDDKMLVLGNPADFAKYLNAYPRGTDTPPTVKEGHIAVECGYDLQDGKWIKKWDIEEVKYSYSDYNNAVENYIKEVRKERGYTDREPTAYMYSSNPRWASDARDWAKFLDEVMLYALPILNEFSNTGNAPTMGDFKQGFPKIIWTYTEESEIVDEN